MRICVTFSYHGGTECAKLISGLYPIAVTGCLKLFYLSGDAISKQRKASKFTEFHHLPEVPVNICE